MPDHRTRPRSRANPRPVPAAGSATSERGRSGAPAPHANHPAEHAARLVRKGLAVLLGFGAAVSEALPAQLHPTEQAALEHKAHGDEAAAASLLLDRVESLIATPALAPIDAARGVAALRLSISLAARIAAEPLRDRIARLASRSDAPTEIRSAAAHATRDAACALGRLPEASRWTRALGYIETFALLGPFDNERGGRFGGPVPAPVLGFDPDATVEGARRPISWRTTSAEWTAADGIFDLAALLAPSEQVLAWACVAIDAGTDDRDALLWLASDESFSVYLNGARLLSRDLRRSFHPDQDRVSLPLRAGLNLLVIELGQQDGPWRFAARLSEPDGSPLPSPGPRTSTDPDDLRRAAATTARETNATPAPPRALELLAAEEGDAADAFRAALLLGLETPDDANDRGALDLADRAVAGLTDQPATLLLRASLRVRAGRAEERDDNARRADYESILAGWPDHAEAALRLAELDLEDLGATERAESLIDGVATAHPEDPDALLLQARLHAARDLDLLAARSLDAARNARQPADPRALRAWISHEIRADRPRSALEAARSVASRDRTADDLVMLARLEIQTGARDAGVETLRAAIREFPLDRTAYHEFARLLAAEGDLDAARRELANWLRVRPEDDATLTQLAELHARAGDAEAQLETLRAALVIDPNRKRERRLLEFLEADTAPFHAPFEVDVAALLAADPGPPADAAEANDSHQDVLRQEIVRAYRNGTRSTYRHRLLRILNPAGATRFNRWIVRHSFREQRARILRARVLHPDGTESRARIRGALATMPPLQAGDVLDVAERIDDLAPSFFGDYFGLEHQFPSPEGVTCRTSELVLLLDPGRSYRFQTRHGVPEPSRRELDDGVTELRYRLTDLPRRIAEDGRPGTAETAPLLRVTTYESWDQFAAWWWNLIRRQSEVSPAMRAKVAELCDGLETDEQRIAALYRFVTTDVRYEAWEFGVHGYQPYSTSVVFDRRHGDCKDKALLLDALLGEVGIQAWPVLIHAEVARDIDDLTLPMVEHFNHCISYLPPDPESGRAGMFLDGTALWHPTDTLPEMDLGARVLVVADGEGRVMQIADAVAVDNADVNDFVLDLTADGGGRLRYTARPTGQRAVPMREFLGSQPGRREELLERRLGRLFGEVRIEELDTSDVDDLDTPVEVTAAATVTRAADPRGDRLALRAVPETSDLQRLASAPERRLPLLLGTPRSERETTRYRLPDGFGAEELPAPVELRESFGSFTLHWSLRDGEVVAERNLTLSTPRIEPEEYPAFRRFASQVDAADRAPVLIRRLELPR